ncbi:salicylate 1-monooxygenase sala [Xylariomycetidae sp. FL2044]|nr:salicylate 1-monooxygenase sala [Xylariomycetidae sp. FL2044]
MATASKKDFEIAIIGGGITGATLAISLLKHNIPVQVYEQGHAFSEIGAGVAFGPNAVRAMKLCDPSIYHAFEEVATHNQWPSKKNIFFDMIDGTADITLFKLENAQGANSVHRGHFMDAMAKLIPEDIAHFRKHLDEIKEDPETGRLTMHFHDGTTAEADAVIGCDGIKSRTRQILFGEDHPAAWPRYSHKYAYRGVMPMKRAIEAIGEERALNACLWMGPGAHLLSIPIDHGETFNMVAIVADENEWPDPHHLTLPAKKEDALRDFSRFGSAVRSQLELVDDNLDKWALFDLADNPVPTFTKGRICLSGDAALLADDSVRGPGRGGRGGGDHLEAAFAAFDASRRERGQWLVRDSRATGDLYEWMTGEEGGVGNDFAGIERELQSGFGRVWDYDLDGAVREAKEDLRTRLSLFLSSPLSLSGQRGKGEVKSD